MNVRTDINKILSIQFYFWSFQYQLHLPLNTAFSSWLGNVASNLLSILHISVSAENGSLCLRFKNARKELTHWWGLFQISSPNKPIIVLSQDHDPVRAEQLHREICKWSRETSSSKTSAELSGVPQTSTFFPVHSFHSDLWLLPLGLRPLSLFLPHL